jgi:ribosomal protein L18E
MKICSALKLITVAVLFFSCTVALSSASMFELEIVPLSKLMENPNDYDSTMAYRKISVVGNLTEINKQYATITEGNHSLRIDMTRIELFDGLNVSDQAMITGEFTHKPIDEDVLYPNYVLHYPIEDAGIVNVSTINNDKKTYNGKYITVIGNISSIENTMGRHTVVVKEIDTENTIKIYYYGATELDVDDVAKVIGLYNGNILHSETMGKKRDKLSISTFLPGFSSIMSISIIGLLAAFIRTEKRNE